VALREAVDQQDFRARRIAPFLRRDGQAVRRLHADGFVLCVLRPARLRGRKQQSGHCGEAEAAQGYRHGRLPCIVIVRKE
jgi:hypothetical protein